ncbi:helix-turn-helix domain-containing protein [Saccharopolyspora hattusasensis]|uniref:helix-turn-helix domain-containing protein n=1 Tax=Saccharopolyspora hattusasensis TaxID=1128679 RepID=UPI003D977D16
MATAIGSPRARALSAALRKAREDRGLSLRDLAKRVSLNYSYLSNLETGKRVPNVETTATIIGALRLSATDREKILALARNVSEPNWLTVGIPGIPHQLAGAWECERAASLITAWNPCVVPGLLQTTDYARSIAVASGLETHEVESRVMVKLSRREILTKRDPVMFKALVAETALREPIGDPTVMVDQLRHLLTIAERSNVVIRIVPQRVGWHPGLMGPFVLYDFADSPSVVHFEHYSSGAFDQNEDDVKAYRNAIKRLASFALSARDSNEFIARLIVDEWSENGETNPLDQV